MTWRVKKSFSFNQNQNTYKHEVLFRDASTFAKPLKAQDVGWLGSNRKISKTSENRSAVLSSSPKITLLVIAAKNYLKSNIKVSQHPPFLLP